MKHSENECFYKNLSDNISEKLDRQEYSQKPLYKKDVCGSSSKAIFKFMTTDSKYICIDEYKGLYPSDLDDFSRNRALLLWYPEWKERLIEMKVISNKWNNLVINWDNIEKLYDYDYEKYGDNCYDKDCNSYIQLLIK